MKVTPSVLTVPGSKMNGQNPLPMFRSRTQNHNPDRYEGDFWPDELLDGFGDNVGFRVLPYRMQDRYDRELVHSAYKLIVLENEYLKASFLPGFGGKLYSLIDKRTGRELLFSNPVLRLGNIAIRNAWVSGGVEWNIGIIGHTFFTCSDVFCALLKDDDNNEFVRIYEFERMKRLYWQIDFHLPSGEELLYSHVRIINPNDHEVGMYWWTDMGIRESEDLRVLSESDRLLYIAPTDKHYPRDQREGKPSSYQFGFAPYEEVCKRFGFDVSFPCLFETADDYFFHAKEIDPAPWVAAAYNDGFVFFNRSTPKLRSRKMFTWGNHKGGRRWCDYLSESGTGYFAEIQSGLAYSQNHTVPMPAHAQWEWTECFSSLNLNEQTDTVMNGPFETAVEEVKNQINKQINPQKLAELDKIFSVLSSREIERLLHNGSGYGALQRTATNGQDPAGLQFSETTIGEEQLPWLNLLDKGCFPAYDRRMDIPSWMANDPVWMELLGKSIAGSDADNAAAHLALGVMLYENGQYDEAEQEFLTSAELLPNPLAYRCLVSCQPGNALQLMEKAMSMDDGSLDKGYWEEYLSLLLSAGKYQEVWNYYNSLTKDRISDRISIMAGNAALHIGEEDFVLTLFCREMQCIREGATDLSELFFRYHTVKEAKRLGVPVSGELEKRIRAEITVPEYLDFRII